MKNKKLVSLVAAGTLISLVSGCAEVVSNVNSEVLVVGMVGAPEVLDPAGTRDLDDLNLLGQLMPTLLVADPVTGDIVPDIAATAEYTAENNFTVKLKEDLTFSNGHELSSSDVVHSIQRVVGIADPAGPAALFASISAVEAIDELTVVITTVKPFDHSLSALLSSPAVLIVDEEIFPSDKLASSDQVASSGAWAGPYKLGGYSQGSALSLEPNSAYKGFWGVPENESIEVRFYSDPEQLMFDSANMVIDLSLVHHRSLVTSTFDATQAFGVDFIEGPLVETGFFTLNGLAGPFSPELYGDNGSSLAITARGAFANLVDKDTVVSEIVGGLYRPANALVPGELSGVAGGKNENEADNSSYERTFRQQSIELPLAISIAYPEDLFGASVSGFVTVFEAELEDSGMFDVELVPLSVEEFQSERSQQTYDALFDYHYPLYSDAGAFLVPFTQDAKRLGIGGRSEAQLDSAIEGIFSESEEDRADSVRAVEVVMAKEAYVVPLLWAGRQALVRQGISGVDVLFSAGGHLVFADLKRIIVK